MGYKVKEAIGLLAQYREEDNELKRLKILSQLEKIAQRESFLFPFVNQIVLLGYKDHVSNSRMDGLLQINFEDIDVEREH